MRKTCDLFKYFTPILNNLTCKSSLFAFYSITNFNKISIEFIAIEVHILQQYRFLRQHKFVNCISYFNNIKLIMFSRPFLNCKLGLLYYLSYK